MKDFIKRKVVPVDRVKVPIDELNVIAKVSFGGNLHLRSAEAKRDYKGPLFLAHQGDLVISKIRVAQGSLCIVPDTLEHLAVSAEYPVYSVDQSTVRAEFIKLVIRTSAFKHRVGRLRSGNTTKARVRPTDFEELSIPIPGLVQQQSLIDAYNTALKQAAECEAESISLVRTSQAAFEEALGITAPKPLPSRPAFIARFKDVERWSHDSILRGLTQLEHAPAKWPLMTLGALIDDIENGWSPQCLDHPAPSDRWGVLKVGAVSFGFFNEIENKELPQKLKPRPQYEVKEGDVIISRANVTRYVGACAYVEQTRPRLMLCDKLFRVVFKANTQLDGRFLAAVMKLPTVREQIETRLTGTSPTMKNISKPALLSLQFPVPDITTQRTLMDNLSMCAKSSAAKALEAVKLRSGSWTAFEAALFSDAAKKSNLSEEKKDTK